MVYREISQTQNMCLGSTKVGNYCSKLNLLKHALYLIISSEESFHHNNPTQLDYYTREMLYCLYVEDKDNRQKKRGREVQKKRKKKT